MSGNTSPIDNNTTSNSNENENGGKYYNKKPENKENFGDWAKKKFFGSEIGKIYSGLFNHPGAPIKEKEEFQKDYYAKIGSLMMKIIESANSSGLSSQIEKEGKSFVTLFHPDNSYKMVSDYKIHDNSDDNHLAYFCAHLSKIVYEKIGNLKEVCNSWFSLEQDVKEVTDSINQEMRESLLKSSSTDSLDVPLNSGLDFLVPIFSSVVNLETYAFLVKVKSCEDIFISFRGTQFFSIKDWNSDFAFDYFKPYEGKNFEVHEGFYNHLFKKGSDGFCFYEKVLSEISKKCNNNSKKKFPKIIVCGHSLGGALASVFAICSEILKSPLEIKKVFTFGSPRIGNDDFVAIHSQKTFRYVNCYDMIPSVPEYMKAHGKEILISNGLIPESWIAKLRSSLPVISLNLTDHYPGEYIQNICKNYNFVFGEKNWEKQKTKLAKEDHLRMLILENSTLKEKNASLTAQVEELSSTQTLIKEENSILKNKIATLVEELERLKLKQKN